MIFGRKLSYLFILNIVFLSSFQIHAQKFHQLEGRWDLEMDFKGETVPSWLEVRHSGVETLVGRFVFMMGSARPVAEVKIHGNKFSFAIPRQWEPEGNDMVLHGELVDDMLKGSMIYTDGSVSSWTGVRAPKLEAAEHPKPGKPMALFNGKSLDGWHMDSDNSQWTVVNGILKNTKGGANLISNEKFTDFNLKVEFRYPKGSNSGIYLRGRYEVQIADNMGFEPSDIYFSGIYGFLEPNENTAKAPGEWQTYNITLIGRRVTIVANGKTVISDQTIPGITGGALDSKEGEPGAFMIQGDHGAVEFRKFEVTPMN